MFRSRFFDGRVFSVGLFGEGRTVAPVTPSPWTRVTRDTQTWTPL